MFGDIPIITSFGRTSLQEIGGKIKTGAEKLGGKINPKTSEVAGNVIDLLVPKNQAEILGGLFTYGTLKGLSKTTVPKLSKVPYLRKVQPILANITSRPLTTIYGGAITTATGSVLEQTWQPKGFGRQLAKAGLASYLIAKSPTLSVAYATQFIKAGVTRPIETSKAFAQQAREKPGEFVGYMLGASAGNFIQQAILMGKAKIYSPYLKETPYLSRDVFRQVGKKGYRERVGALIYDSKGRVLMGYNKKSGTLISPGGGREVGQSLLQALKDELKQELGVKPENIQLVKKILKLDTPGERQIYYKVELKPGTKLYARSDISGGLKWVNPKEGYAGPTLARPSGYRTGLLGKVMRSDEGYVLSRLRTLEGLGQKYGILGPTYLRNVVKSWQKFLKQPKEINKNNLLNKNLRKLDLVNKEITKLQMKNKGSRFVEESYDALAPTKSKSNWTKKDLDLYKELLKKQDLLIKERNYISSLQQKPSSINLNEMYKDKNIYNQALKELGQKFGKENLKGLSQKEIIQDYILYKENMLPRYITLKEKGYDVLFGRTSRYNMQNQQRFTDIYSKLKRAYNQKLIKQIPVNPTKDILRLIPDITYSDILFYKKYAKTYLSAKKTLITSASSEGLRAQNIGELLTNRREVLTGKSKRTSGGARGIYASPEVRAKGDISPAGGVSKRTLGYAAMTYFGIGAENAPLAFSLVGRSRPALYSGMERVSGKAFKLVGKMNKQQLIKYIESQKGSVQPTLNSLFGREGEVVIPGGTILKVKRSPVRSVILAGQKVEVLRYQVIRDSATLKRVNKNIDILKNRASSSMEKNGALNSLKKDTGIDYSKSSEIPGTKYKQLTAPPVPRYKEKQDERIKERIFAFEGLISTPKEIPKPSLKERGVPMMRELSFPALIETPRPQERRIPERPPREPPPTPPPRTPPPNIINNMFRQLPRGRRRMIKKKEKRIRSSTLPTAFEQLLGGVKPGQRARVKIRGFEALRFR
jgi:8-oxo-dGTP pyrophosphatase MutT (NUDIX family)